MAKIHLYRIRKRYGWTGGKYEELMQKILAANSLSMANAVARVKVGRLREGVRKMGPKWRTLALPNVQDVLPKRSVFLKKGAERGKLLADDLRAQLALDLRRTMKEFETKTGRPGYVKLTGVSRGRISEDFVDAFEGRIRETFAAYTRVDPDIGVPSNVRAIAITETRGTINEVKHDYFQRLEEKNRGLQIRKRWKHNPSLSMVEPRPGHAKMDGKEVGIDEMFEVPGFEKVDGEWEPTGGITLMLHPHDPKAGPEEVISCHCDVDYVARRVKE